MFHQSQSITCLKFVENCVAGSETKGINRMTDKLNNLLFSRNNHKNIAIIRNEQVFFALGHENEKNHQKASFMNLAYYCSFYSFSFTQ